MKRARARGSRKTPGQSRTRPIPARTAMAGNEDAGKFYRCWNCGFPCDVDRDELGGSADRAGTSYSDYAVHAYGDFSSDYQSHHEKTSKVLVLGGIGHSHVVLKNGINGDPVGVRHSIYEDGSGSGCPFCGTRNWRGDY